MFLVIRCIAGWRVMSELVWQAADRSHVLRGCPHRMDPAVEVVVLEMRDVILLRLPTRLVTRKLQALSCSAQMQPTTHSDHASNVP